MTDDARQAAFDVLRALDERDAYLNLLLPALLRERGVRGRDAAFATELAHGTVRWRGSYDAILAALTNGRAVEPAVLDALRLGTHQILSMRLPALREFSDEHGLALISIEDLKIYRRRFESQVERRAETRLPTEFGEFKALGYLDVVSGAEHIALVFGDPAESGALVRVHSECLTGDVFGSRRCDCGPQLQASMDRLYDLGARGILVTDILACRV